MGVITQSALDLNLLFYILKFEQIHFTNTFFCNLNKLDRNINLNRYILQLDEIQLTICTNTFYIWTIIESAADLTLVSSHLQRALIGLDHSYHYYWVVSIFLIDCFVLLKVLSLQFTQQKWVKHRDIQTLSSTNTNGNTHSYIFKYKEH